jgi:hypothetical protein
VSEQVLLRDLVAIPDTVHDGDFVLTLAKGVRDKSTITDYVVTEQLAADFDKALDLIKSALETGASRAAYLNGSFGSGKSHAGGLVIGRRDQDLRWWTWAGYRVNATLKATLGGVADEAQRVDDFSIRLRGDLRPSSWRGVIDAVHGQLCLPEVDEKALAGLKFSEALPQDLVSRAGGN